MLFLFLILLSRLILVHPTEGESKEEKVVIPSSLALDFYRRLFAVSSKAWRELFRKSSSGIQLAAESGRVHFTGILKSLNTAFDSVQKTPLNGEKPDSDRSGDICKSSGAEALVKQSK